MQLTKPVQSIKLKRKLTKELKKLDEYENPKTIVICECSPGVPAVYSVMDLWKIFIFSLEWKSEECWDWQGWKDELTSAWRDESQNDWVTWMENSWTLRGGDAYQQNGTTCLSLRQEHSSADGVSMFSPTVWNALPSQLCSSSISRGQLRAGLKTHLFTHVYGEKLNLKIRWCISAERHDMLVPSTRTQLGRQSFHVAAQTVWNVLTSQLHSSSISRGQLRAGLKTRLFTQAYGHVWELLLKSVLFYIYIYISK